MTGPRAGRRRTQQTRKVALFFAEPSAAWRYRLRDDDGKFVPEFDQILQAEGVEIVRTQIRSPNMNAYAERFVQSIRTECLDHFLVFGEAHLRHLIFSYLTHYLEERPHQGVGNVPLSGAGPPSCGDGAVVCDERLGGLLKHYRRVA